MEHQRVTCPETGHLEEIDFERTTAGIVVDACSRFDPASDVACPRECAKRMDARKKLDGDEWTERVLVAYADSDDGRTRAIAEVLADHLKRDGLVVEVAEAGSAPPPEDYDAVVVGSGIKFGRYARPATRYIEQHHDTLAAMPTFWFSVCPDTAPESRDPGSYLRQLARKTSWHPTDSATFCPPRKRSPSALQRIVGALVRRPGGSQPWPTVHDFALRIAEQVPSAHVQVRVL